MQAEQKAIPNGFRRFVWIVALAFALNAVAWVGAAWRPDGDGNWGVISLGGFFVLGLAIGRWWALFVTLAFGVIHAIPVYLGLLPGYLSTWGEALWWAFALTLLVTVTAFGVTGGVTIRWIKRRFAAKEVT